MHGAQVLLVAKTEMLFAKQDWLIRTSHNIQAFCISPIGWVNFESYFSKYFVATKELYIKKLLNPKQHFKQDNIWKTGCNANHH